MMFPHVFASIMKLIASSAYFITWFFAFSDGVISADIWDNIQKFGLPTVLLVFVMFYANKQNEKRMQEQRDYWANNENYMRQLISEAKSANTCKFEKN